MGAVIFTSVAGCILNLPCRRNEDFETSRDIPLQNLMQEQVYFFVDFEGILGIETAKIRLSYYTSRRFLLATQAAKSRYCEC